MYTWTITTKTMNTLTPEHRNMLQRMIVQLQRVYKKCEETERSFCQVITLLNAFRDIIISWPTEEFSAAYGELTEWQRAFMGGF